MTPTALVDPLVRRDTAAHPDPTTSAVDGSRTAVDKAFELLAAFPGGGTTVGVSELARTKAQSKSTVFRLLTAMERNGFVERHDGRYRLGRRLYDIGAQVYEPRPCSRPRSATSPSRSTPRCTVSRERSYSVVITGVSSSCRLPGRGS